MVFVSLYTFMMEESLVQAEVSLDWSSATNSPDGVPVTLGGCIARTIPNAVNLKLQAKVRGSNSFLASDSKKTLTRPNQTLTPNPA